MIYFDNAATTFPKPQTILPALRGAALVYGGNPGRSGHKVSLRAAEKVYEVRKKAADFFGADVENTIFATNCTHALNMAIKGVMKGGGHVVTSCLEHNSVLRPLHKLQKDGLITYTVVDVLAEDMDILTNLEKAIRSDTRAIVITHASNVLGRVMPVAEIGRLCKRRGLKLVVDAAQSAGVLPINIRELGINVLCMPGHKGLYGGSGTGLMLLNDIDPIDTLLEGGTGSVSNSLEQPEFNPDRYESGTLNTYGILTLGAGLDFVRRRGIENLYRHEMSLCRYVWQQLRKIPGVTVYQESLELGKSVPILLFNIDGMSSMETAKLLDDAGFCLRGGLHCAPLVHERLGTAEQGAVRFSPGAFNQMPEAAAFVANIKKIVKNRRNSLEF